MLSDDFDLNFDQRTSSRPRWTWALPLAVMACLAWFLAPWRYDSTWESPHANISYEVDVVDWKAVHAAYTSTPERIPEKQRRPILRLLMRASRSLNPTRRDDDIDFDRAIQRIEQTGYVKQLSDKDRSVLAESLRDEIFVDYPTRRLQLIALKPVRTSEWIAYTRGWVGNQSHAIRWWLSKQGGRWRWFDWQELGNRRMMSEELAVRWVYRNQPLWKDAFLGGAWNKSGGPPLSLIRDHWYQGRRKAAVDKLTAAEAQLVHRFVNDGFRVELARIWAEFHRIADAQRLLAQVERPHEVPDFYLIAADCLAAAGEWKQALMQIGTYEDRLGPTPESSRRRLVIARRRGKVAEALAACRHWLDCDPLATEPYLAAAELATEDDFGEFVKRMSRNPGGRRAMQSLALAAIAQDRRAAWQNLHAMAQTLAPEGPAAHVLASRRAEWRGDLRSAADEMYQALQSADANSRRRWNAELIRLLIATHQWERLLEDTTGPTYALYRLLTRQDWSTTPFAPGELIALVERFRREHPDSEWGDILTVKAAAAEENWEQVLHAVRTATHPAAVRRNARARAWGVIAEFRVAGPMAALRHAPRRDEAVELIGTRLVDEHQWEMLQAFLSEIRRGSTRDDLAARGWVQYLSAMLQLHKNQPDEAKHLLMASIVSANLSEQPGWIRDRAVPVLIRLSFDDGSWRQLLADPRVGAHEWPLWIEELQRRCDADAENRHLFQEFLTAYEEFYAREPEVVWWHARNAWEAQDFAKVVETLQPWPRKAMLTLPVEREQLCRKMLVLSLARLGRWDELARVAVEAAAEGDRTWLTWYAAMQRDGNELARQLPTLSEQHLKGLLEEPHFARLYLGSLLPRQTAADGS